MTKTDETIHEKINISLKESLFPIILLIVFLSFNVYVYGDDAMGGSNQFILLVGAAAGIALGIYKNIEGSIEKNTNKIGYVPQKISIDWTLPIRVIDFMSLTEEPTEKQINIALNLTGVEHLKNKSLGNLSGGEFQRVLIARAIAKQPDILVLDEPVQGVDFKGQIALYELIKKISEELNCGILLISNAVFTVNSK